MKTYKKLNLTYTEVDNFIRFIENSSRGVTR